VNALRLDHIMYATPDLEAGIAEIARLTGVTAVAGGSHPGQGTRNALLSLGDDQYLEIIAPDPAQRLTGTLGAQLIERGRAGIRGWAVATNDLAAPHATAARLTLAPQPIIDMTRTTPDGVRLDWQLFTLRGNPLLPFFIDWKGSPHPARNAPSGCRLSAFRLCATDVSATRALLSAFEINVEVLQGQAGFSAQLQTPRGAAELSSW
jgi:hypothetical protein